MEKKVRSQEELRKYLDSQGGMVWIDKKPSSSKKKDTKYPQKKNKKKC